MPDWISAPNITVLLALFGWLIVHWLTKSREIEAARRNLRASYLMEAYRSIENSILRENLQPEDNRRLERAVADIELLGNKKQIDLIHDLITFSMKNPAKESEIRTKKFDLLDELQEELRELFKLENSQLDKRVVLRLENKNNSSNTLNK